MCDLTYHVSTAHCHYGPLFRGLSWTRLTALTLVFVIPAKTRGRQAMARFMWTRAKDVLAAFAGAAAPCLRAVTLAVALPWPGRRARDVAFYADAIREHLVDLKPDGSFRLDQRAFTYAGGLRMTGRAFERLFGGPARAPEGPLTQREMDLAASVQAVTEEAADQAERAAPLTGWVNNAAVFRDASVHTAPAREVLDLVQTNLAPAVVGATTAVRRFLAAGTGGAIVNVSSHQAQRAVPGCTPYVTAKAAIEGLTRALAVGRGVEAPHQLGEGGDLGGAHGRLT